MFTRTWLVAALNRALRTMAQAAIAAIGTTAVLEGVDWLVVASTAGLAAVLSLLTSLAGLPEVDTRTASEIEADEQAAGNDQTGEPYTAAGFVGGGAATPKPFTQPLTDDDPAA